MDINVKRPVRFLGNSQETIQEFPADVRRGVGYALDQAQRGRRADNVKSLKGFGGASVLEVVEDHQYVPCDLHGALCGDDLRPARFSEEV